MLWITLVAAGIVVGVAVKCLANLARRRRLDAAISLISVNDSPEEVESFLNAGLDVNLRDGRGSTLLHQASTLGRVKVMASLLSAGANVAIRDKLGLTALQSATMGGTAVVDTLQEHGVPSQSQGSEVEAVQLLLDRGADPNDGKPSPLSLAISKKNEAVAALLLARGADPYECGTETSPLIQAVSAHMTATVAVILSNKSQGATHVAKGLSALHVAATKGFVDIVVLLLDSGTDVNVTTPDGLTPLAVAIAGGRPEVANLLLDRGADVRSTARDGSTPLHFAAMAGQSDVLDELLDRGADVSEHNGQGATPLILTALKPSVECAKRLVSRGAAITEATVQGDRVLHALAVSPMAQGECEATYEEYVRFGMATGLDIDVSDKNGMTPLHRAILAKKTRLVAALLACGADVNRSVPVRNVNATQLWVIADGDEELLTVLCGAGARMSADGHSDMSPLALAMQAGHEKQVEWLIARGAKRDSVVELFARHCRNGRIRELVSAARRE